MPAMSGRLISESIKPVTQTADTSRMAIGEPGLPREFVWRGQTVTVRAVLRSWRETGKCHHGSREMYVRKHWYEVVTHGLRRHHEALFRKAGQGREESAEMVVVQRSRGAR